MLEVRRDTYRADRAPVFPARNGQPLHPSNVANRGLKSAARSVGLGWVSFHTFRHTCASLLFKAGKDVKQVQEWLGHADPVLTLRTYIHSMDDGLGDADFFDTAVGFADIDETVIMQGGEGERDREPPLSR